MFRNFALFTVFLGLVTPFTTSAETPQRPPVPRFNFTAADIKQRCDNAVSRFSQRVEHIISDHEYDLPESIPDMPPALRSDVPPKVPKKPSFASLIVPLDQATADLVNTTLPMTVMVNVTIDAEIRAQAAECKKAVDAVERDLFSNPRLAEKIHQFAAPLQEDAQRLYDEYVDNLEAGGAFHQETRYSLAKYNPYKGPGFDYVGTQRDFYLGLLKRLDALTVDFKNNANSDTSYVVASEGQLRGAGISETAIAGLVVDCEEDDGTVFYRAPIARYWVTILKNSPDADLRRETLRVYENRAVATNQPIVLEIMFIFNAIAKFRAQIESPRNLHGQAIQNPVYADYLLEGSFVGDQNNLSNYWTRLETDMKPIREQEYNDLLELKKEAVRENKLLALTDDELMLYDSLGERTLQLQPWDVYYYPIILAQKRLGFDISRSESIFPYESLVSNVFALSDEIFGIAITEVKADSCKDCFWITSAAKKDQPATSQIRLYQVANVDGNKKPGDVLGYFYLDPFPRAGKFARPAAFPLTVGGLDQDGKRRLPVGILSVHLGVESNDHYRVYNFLHEFGHVLHQIVTQANYYSQAGTNVVTDFKEMVAQTLEYFMWRKAGLEMVADLAASSHSADPLDSDAILQAMEDSFAYLRGASYYARQVFYGKLHMVVRGMRVPGLDLSKVNVNNPAQLARAVYEQTVGITPLPDTNMLCGFEQLLIGAPYYSYNWGDTYAYNMFSRFEKNGLFDSKTGRRYRNLIMAPGDSKDPRRQVELFMNDSNEIEDNLPNLDLHILAKAIVESDAKTRGNKHDGYK